MIEFNKEKFKNLVLYVCDKCDPKELGSTKLNKVLWYVDTISYTYRGTPITGETYTKQKYGPIPKHILPVVAQLEESGQLASRSVEYFGHDKTEYFALKKPNLKQFDGEEVGLVDDVIEVICREHTAKSISDASHDRIWELAQIGEDIPYCAVLASKIGEINNEDIEWAKENASRRR